ncbi:membrane-targeted effector domain-containing toxin [Zooshikella marina]|uniref:membrane-targeted effector domain-containing toxin n=1 Tax=Zooshikella ganghwensis TaxID=202772 RepID=UPI001BAF0FFE|nr:membrane-targeted effector domain-containing toxin [Zooshikella ganghwensis]MBU2708447.1 membrane-targeted effector domain-containing toxin [Zooshikella ganghwensis]
MVSVTSDKGFQWENIPSVELFSEKASVFLKQQGERYRTITSTLTELHATTRTDQKLEKSFQLLSQINHYMATHAEGSFSRVPALRVVADQISQTLFQQVPNSWRQKITTLSSHSPKLASQILQTALDEIKGGHPGLTSFLLSAAQQDELLIDFKGFQGDVPSDVVLGFPAKLHVNVADIDNYQAIKAHILNAQRAGLLEHVAFDDSQQRIDLGYSYTELTELSEGHGEAKVATFLLKNASSPANLPAGYHSTNRLTDFLAHTANPRYLAQWQEQRLDQLKRIYESSYQFDFRSFDNTYSEQQVAKLNEQLDTLSIADKIQQLLTNKPGLLLGENHSSDLLEQKFIVDNMDTLKSNGVTTIGLEHFRSELAQPLIDDFFKTGEFSADLEALLKAKDHKGYLRQILTEARTLQLNVIALDNESSIRSSAGYNLVYRAGSANNIAVDTLSALPANEKFVVIYGSAHLESHPGLAHGLPGITQRLSIPQMTVSADGQLVVHPDNLDNRIPSPALADVIIPDRVVTASSTQFSPQYYNEVIDNFVYGYQLKKSGSDIHYLLNAEKFRQRIEQPFNALPDNLKNALNFYIGNRSGIDASFTEQHNGLYFYDINNYLRGLRDPGAPHLDKVMTLTSELNEILNTLSGEPVRSYRAFDASPIQGLANLEVGQLMGDVAAMSSSENPNFVRGWFKTRMSNQPVEKPAVFIIDGLDGVNTGTLTNKSEVIYKPGSVFELVHKKVVDVELLPGITQPFDFYVIKQVDPTVLDPKQSVLNLAGGTEQTVGAFYQHIAEKIPNYQSPRQGFDNLYVHGTDNVREYLGQWQQNLQHIDQFHQRLTEVDANLRWRPAPQSVLTIEPNVPYRNGVCAALATAWAHAVYLDTQDQGNRAQHLLDNLFTVGAIRSEQVAGPISKHDQTQAQQFLNALDTLNLSQTTAAVLPSGLSESLGELSTHHLLQHIVDNIPTSGSVDTYLISTPNHTMAVTVGHDTDGWHIQFNDPTVGQVNNIQSPQHLQTLLAKHLTDLQTVYAFSANQLHVEKVNHTAFASHSLNHAIEAQYTPIETTVDQLRAQDTAQGKLSIGGQVFSRVELYRLGTFVDGQPISAAVDVTQSDFVSRMTFRHDKVLAFVKGQDQATTHRLAQLVEYVATQRQLVGQSPGVMIDAVNPQHVLLMEHQRLNATRFHFDQAKQLLHIAKTNGLTVELSPAAMRSTPTALADVLMMAAVKHQDGDIANTIAHQNRARFTSALARDARASHAETVAVERYTTAQMDLLHQYQQVTSRRDLGTLTIKQLTDQFKETGDKAFALQAGKHHYLISQQAGQLAFYDPSSGWLNGFADAHALQGFLTQYFSDATRLQLGTTTSAFSVTALTADFLNSSTVNQAVTHLQQPIAVELERLAQLDADHGPLIIEGQLITRAQLWQLGAEVKGKPISVAALSGDWTPNLSLNAEVLKQHLATASDTTFNDSARILKALAAKERITVNNLVEGHTTGALQRALHPIDTHRSLSLQQIQGIQHKLSTTRLNLSTLKNMGLQVPGVGLQAFGIYSGVKAANAAEARGDYKEAAIQRAGVAANVISIGAELALDRIMPQLGQKLTAQFAGSTSRFAASSSQLGKLVGRGAGVVAGLITLPFDVYSAYKAFSDAAAEGLTDDQRQDLYVQGGFAVAGATLSLSLMGASLVYGAAATGPFGLVAAGVLIYASTMYAAARQAQEIGKYVPQLEGAPAFEYALREMVGWDMDKWAKDLYLINKTEQSYVEQVSEESARLLQGALGETIDTIVFGDISAFVDRQGNVQVTPFDDVIFAENGIEALHQHEDAIGLRRTNVVRGDVDENKAVFFNTGGGTDTIKGVLNKKNNFLLGAGSKAITGGNLDDNFTVSIDGQTIKNVIDHQGEAKYRLFYELEGGEGQNTLVINTDDFTSADLGDHYNGFLIDLQQGKIWLHHSEKKDTAENKRYIGALTNIQNTIGSAAGADKIIGSDDDNRLLANGHDHVFGMGGTDVITLTDSAWVDGGEGQDMYFVQRGIEQAVIRENGNDVSMIRLAFSVKEIHDWQLQGTDLVISIHADGQSKQLTIKDVYQQAGNVFQRVNDQLSFQTTDGLLLVPQLTKEFSSTDASQFSSVKLTARYLKATDKTYRNVENGVTIDLAKNTVDGPNAEGSHHYTEPSQLDTSNLTVIKADDPITSSLKNDTALVQRAEGSGASYIRLSADTHPGQSIKTIYLDYDADEIAGINTVYLVKNLDLKGPIVQDIERRRYQGKIHGYNSLTGELGEFDSLPVRIAFQRTNYMLALRMKNGHRLVLQGIKADTTHYVDDNIRDYVHEGGEQLWDYEFITRDGIKITRGELNTYPLGSDQHIKHYRPVQHRIRRVPTLDTHPREDLTLSDWQWGQGQQLDVRYQLTGEGSAFADTILGDNTANILRGYGGDDYLAGKNGHDTYVIGAAEGRVTIDNLAEDSALDSVILATHITHIATHREGMDLVIIAQLPQAQEEGEPLIIQREVILKNYFVSDLYRHLNIVSAEGHQQQLVVDDTGLSRFIIAAESTDEPVVVPELLSDFTNLHLARAGHHLHAVIAHPLAMNNEVQLTEVVFQNFYLGGIHQNIRLTNGRVTLSGRELLGLALPQSVIERSQLRLDTPQTSHVLVGSQLEHPMYSGTDSSDVVLVKDLGNVNEINLGHGNNTLDFSMMNPHLSPVIVSLESEQLYAQNHPITLKNITNVIGTALADNIRGNRQDNVLIGGEGNDVLTATSGQNTLVGGHGNDEIRVGDGSDTIIFAKGDGKDAILAGYGGSITGDVLSLKDIHYGDIHFSLTEDTLLSGVQLNINFKGQLTDSITIDHWNETDAFYVATEDGSVIDRQGIDLLIQALAGFEASDWVNSTASMDDAVMSNITAHWTISATLPKH